jgi:heme/copper-type cytochrome/quinol oxidase subunit 2
MHGWFVGEHEVWMAIAWLTVVGLFITLVWSIVLSASLRFRNDKNTHEHDSKMTKAA